MDLLLVLLTPLLLIGAFKVSSRDQFKGHRAKILSVLLGVPFAIFFGDELLERGYLHRLCAKTGGYQYQELLKADGYFDVDNTEGCGSRCLEALTRWGYSYYETEVRDKYAHLAPTKGFYKYYLVKSDSGMCAVGKAISREKRAYGILPEDKCVAYEIVSEPSSRYEVSMIRSTDVVTSPFRLEKVFSYVKDRKTNEVVASATSYRYWGGWLRNNSIAHNSATGCPEFNNSHGAIQSLILTSNAK
jgi:hypothetical protein